MSKISGVVALVLVVGCSPEREPDAPNLPVKGERPWVELYSSSAPVTSILQSIRDQSGRDIRFEEALLGELDLSLHAPWDIALEAVTCAAGLRAEWDGRTVRIGRNMQGNTAFTAAPPPTESPPPLPDFSANETLIDLDADGAPLSEVMAQISQKAAVPIEVDDDLDIAITEHFKSIHWRLAVDLLANTYMFEINVTQTGLRAAPINCGVRLRFDQIGLREALQLLGVYGANVVVLPQVERSGPFRAVIYGDVEDVVRDLCQEFGVSVEFKHGVALVAPKSLGWGK